VERLFFRGKSNNANSRHIMLGLACTPTFACTCITQLG
jgi:hypothetical protein